MIFGKKEINVLIMEFLLNNMKG
ncbi:hypothetical protein F383_13580 [Gossypium arboreum]|uniref:Uncharacterized protein n=1 Tax=Gossypium arboreum TaxID=29729 RepID=A0A0B0MEA7_GOSAR|nr:hypothetical protein F383_13580 [Gossypium arboreum]